MTLHITIAVNAETIRTISAWNVGHPDPAADPEHDDLRRYNFGVRNGPSGFVLHRRGHGAAELARKVLEQISVREGTFPGTELAARGRTSRQASEGEQ